MDKSVFLSGLDQVFSPTSTHSGGLPVAVCIPAKADGGLPSGEALRAAIEAVAGAPPPAFGASRVHPLHEKNCSISSGAPEKRGLELARTAARA